MLNMRPKVKVYNQVEYKARDSNLMSQQAQKLHDEYQEGSYKRRKSGKIVNDRKPIKTSTCNASGVFGCASECAQPPPVPLQHFGKQNNIDTSLDYLDLDPELPSMKEVRCSYSKVRFQIYLLRNEWTIELFQRLKISIWKCGS